MIIFRPLRSPKAFGRTRAFMMMSPLDGMPMRCRRLRKIMRCRPSLPALRARAYSVAYVAHISLDFEILRFDLILSRRYSSMMAMSRGPALKHQILLCAPPHAPRHAVAMAYGGAGRADTLTLTAQDKMQDARARWRQAIRVSLRDMMSQAHIITGTISRPTFERLRYATVNGVRPAVILQDDGGREISRRLSLNNNICIGA